MLLLPRFKEVRLVKVVEAAIAAAPSSPMLLYSRSKEVRLVKVVEAAIALAPSSPMLLPLRFKEVRLVKVVEAAIASTINSDVIYSRFKEVRLVKAAQAAIALAPSAPSEVRLKFKDLRLDIFDKALKKLSFLSSRQIPDKSSDVNDVNRGDS
jgi:hypothetical protein